MQLNRPIAGSARKEPKKTYGFVALDERLFPERISSGLIEADSRSTISQSCLDISGAN